MRRPILVTLVLCGSFSGAFASAARAQDAEVEAGVEEPVPPVPATPSPGRWGTFPDASPDEDDDGPDAAVVGWGALLGLGIGAGLGAVVLISDTAGCSGDFCGLAGMIIGGTLLGTGLVLGVIVGLLAYGAELAAHDDADDERAVAVSPTFAVVEGGATGGLTGAF